MLPTAAAQPDADGIARLISEKLLQPDMWKDKLYQISFIDKAVDWLRGRDALKGEPLINSVAAVSVGIVEGTPLLDLAYVEDSAAEVDLNVVATGDGRFVEVQGTAEGAPFQPAELNAMLALAQKGMQELFELQQAALAD